MNWAGSLPSGGPLPADGHDRAGGVPHAVARGWPRLIGGLSIGRISGGMIEIIDGLRGGEEIVAVGAPYLAEGMRVTRMALTEQAVPRDSDPS